MVTPIITDVELVPFIWPKEEPVSANVESVRLPVMMEYLLELSVPQPVSSRVISSILADTSSVLRPLMGPNPNTWRKLKLLRYCDKTDHRFRLLLAGGQVNNPPAECKISPRLSGCVIQ